MYPTSIDLGDYALHLVNDERYCILLTNHCFTIAVHDEKILLKLLESRKGCIREFQTWDDEGFYEMQPSKRGAIIRKVTFLPKYKRTAILIAKDQLDLLTETLKKAIG